MQTSLLLEQFFSVLQFKPMQNISRFDLSLELNNLCCFLCKLDMFFGDIEMQGKR